MTHKQMLSMVRHFYPNIENPNLVIMVRSELSEAIDKNYRAINPDVESDVVEKYLDRGFIKTITGRYVRNVGEHVIYETLLSESARDIEKELYLRMNCSSPDAKYFICEKEDVKKTCAEVQGIIDSFKWKLSYKVRFGVVDGNETDCT